MKTFLSFICIIGLVLGAVTAVSATPFVGSITENEGTLVGGGYWTDDDVPPFNDATLSWEVAQDPVSGLWTYAYTFSADEHALSHIIIQVSDTFTLANVFDGTTNFNDEDLKTHDPTAIGDPGPNPGLPGPVYGIKWETTGDPLTYSWTIVTDREPMWGNFYAVDGKGANPTYAYNSQFLADAPLGYGDGNAGGWVLVPDTNPVPEPATMLLFGSGLIGLAAAGRKKFRKV